MSGSTPLMITPPSKSASMALSSSPSLPSPSQLLSTMPSRTKIENRAVSIAVAGFTTASSLLRRARSSNPDESQLIAGRLQSIDAHDPEAQAKLATPNAKQSRVAGNGSKPKFKVPKLQENVEREPPQPNEQTQDLESHLPSKDAPRSAQDASKKKPGKKKKTELEEGVHDPEKKKRRKKSTDGNDVQTKMKKPKITKPDTTKTMKSKKIPKENIKRPEAPPLNGVGDGLLDPLEAPLDVELVEAVRRRKAWTPVKDDVPRRDADTNDTSLGEVPEPIPFAQFGQLLSDFGFTGEHGTVVNTTDNTRLPNGESFVKKRKIDLVAGTTKPPGPVDKTKRITAPKKKAQTITEKATAPFAAVSEPLTSSSLLQYLTASPSIPENQRDTDPHVVQKPERRPAGKPKTKAKASSQSKKQSEKVTVLVSPQTAIKSAREQDLVFGTSSQLVRETSPSSHRNLQYPLDESGSIQTHSAVGFISESSLSLPPSLGKLTNSMAFTPSRNLWFEAHRGLDHSLLEAEVVDLVDTPRPSRLQGEIKQQPSPPKKAADAQSVYGDEINSDDLAALEHAIEDKHEDVEEDRALPRSVAEAALRKRPRTRSPQKRASPLKASIPSEIPNYKGFTDAQLSKAIKAYGFKTIKGREAMINMLEKCWASQKSKALQELPSNINLQPPIPNEEIDTHILKPSSLAKKKGRPPKDKDADSTPKKARGRPKKDPSASTPPAKRKSKAKAKAKSPERPLSSTMVDPADDIDDPCPPTPAPPRRRTPSKSHKQLPLSPPRGTTVPSPIHNKDPSEGRARLMAQISKAVKTFPPTHDPKNLTWYEKILMYDPIVLEDLTIWLNTTGLNRIEEDDEVEPALVKEWCEANSICCLWRENQKGGARARW